jgi:antitoxin ParD1/3/4
MASEHEIRTLNISLPEAMREFVNAEVTRGQYTSASEYLRELIRKAQQERRVIDLILPGGADGGPPPGVTKTEWNELRNTLARTKFEELRASLDEAAAQFARGEGRPLDVEKLKAESRLRLKQRRKQ